jgi:CheY-like chemotaxis protein
VAVVLIVEDDTQVRKLAEAVLQGAGYETRSASTRAEAQAFLVSDQRFDALFTDISLFDEREAGLDLAEAAGSCRADLPVGCGSELGFLSWSGQGPARKRSAKPHRPESLGHGSGGLDAPRR